MLLRPAIHGDRGSSSPPPTGASDFPAEYGLSWLLPRLIGLTRAADILLSNRIVLAEEAEVLGLVNKVVAPADLMDTTYSYAHALATEDRPVIAGGHQAAAVSGPPPW